MLPANVTNKNSTAETTNMVFAVHFDIIRISQTIHQSFVLISLIKTDFYAWGNIGIGYKSEAMVSSCVHCSFSKNSHQRSLQIAECQDDGRLTFIVSSTCFSSTFSGSRSKL